MQPLGGKLQNFELVPDHKRDHCAIVFFESCDAESDQRVWKDAVMALRT